MRRLLNASILIWGVFMANASTADPGIEPHAMFYYQISLDGANRTSAHQFGLRLDQTLVERDQTPDYGQLMARPALLDLNMGYRGIRYLTLAGQDYSSGLPAVLRQNDEQDGEQTQAPTEEEEGVDLEKFLDETPKGWFIGIGIGIAIFAGVGD